MSQPINQTSGDPTTRLKATLVVLNQELNSLASQGNYQVGLWLMGHRLAWEDSATPGLLEQDDYLAQSNGFGALKNLVPSEDIEMVRHVRLLKPEHLPVLANQLSTLKPWGESPVYLATTRALQGFGVISKTEAKGLILLTDGGDERFHARQQADMQTVLEQHYRRHVPIHIIGLSLTTSSHGDVIKQYRELARRTGGSFRTVDSAIDLQRAFEQTLQTIAHPDDAAHETVAGGQPSEAGAAMSATTVAVERGRSIARSQIDGVVLYFGQPVPNATVRAVGNFSRSTKSDKRGNFTLADLPPGDYELQVEGIARNQIRDVSRTVTVRPHPQSPPFVEMILE
ncbi:MAG TPA: carboxypeptidase regulatory-like domain-containing protein [Pirellulales bacterium]|nr:carboxypeptidase regulatory-like domain-containing protein [Pirellulales bacterium]